jgi:hypothetical protein
MGSPSWLVLLSITGLACWSAGPWKSVERIYTAEHSGQLADYLAVQCMGMQ